MSKRLKVTRTVTPETDGDWIPRTFNPGDELFKFNGPTYGCIDWKNGVAVSEEDNKNPFFQFPLDAFEEDN